VVPLLGDARGLTVADADPVLRLVNEFAAVEVSLDRSANGPRLLVTDTESGRSIHLDPLELASFCEASEEDRRNWLRVGPYKDDP
jgi:hypothetical protein